MLHRGCIGQCPCPADLNVNRNTVIKVLIVCFVVYSGEQSSGGGAECCEAEAD